MSEQSPHQQVVNFNVGGAEDRLLLGFLLIALGEACFVLMGIFIRLASEEIPLIQIMFFRNFFALLLIGVLVHRLGSGALISHKKRLHFLRAVVGLTAMFFMVYSFSQLKLSEATLLKSLSPIIIPFVAWLVLRERIGLLTWLAIGIAFIGVLIIIAPSGLSLTANLGFLAGLTAAMMASLAKVIVRKLGATDRSEVIVFYFSFYGTLITAPLCFYFWQAMSLKAWLLVLICAVAASAGQLLVTKAYTIARAGRVGMFSYISMPIAGLLGWLIWSETMSNTLLLGFLMIMVAGYLNYHDFKGIRKQTESGGNK